MSGVSRRLLGGVLAISLFVCSSLSAFAIVYQVEPNFPVLQFFQLNDYSGNLIDSLDYLSGENAININEGGFTSYSYRPSSAFSLGVNDAGNAGINFFARQLRGAVSLASDAVFQILPKAPAAGIYIATFSFLSDYDITSVSGVGTRLRIYDYTTSSSTSSRFRFDSYPEFSLSSAASTDGLYYNTVTLYVDMPLLYGEADSSVNRIDYNLLVSGLPTDALYYNLNFSFSSLNLDLPLSSSISDRSYFGSILTSGFERMVSALRTLISKNDSEYIAVTDPSTSQEIQEAQGMIDTVEGFESQLHANITTEFDKIDFTTPTNLAAPVAYIGDKVTRSMNSLGNYQPLIFVPLTLGIMLIMLGRGVSALGSLVSSSSRAVARIRSKGDDS